MSELSVGKTLIGIDINLEIYSFVQFGDVGCTNAVVGCTADNGGSIINDGD